MEADFLASFAGSWDEFGVVSNCCPGGEGGGEDEVVVVLGSGWVTGGSGEFEHFGFKPVVAGQAARTDDGAGDDHEDQAADELFARDSGEASDEGVGCGTAGDHDGPDVHAFGHDGAEPVDDRPAGSASVDHKILRRRGGVGVAHQARVELFDAASDDFVNGLVAGSEGIPLQAADSECRLEKPGEGGGALASSLPGELEDGDGGVVATLAEIDSDVPLTFREAGEVLDEASVGWAV